MLTKAFVIAAAAGLLTTTAAYAGEGHDKTAAHKAGHGVTRRRRKDQENQRQHHAEDRDGGIGTGVCTGTARHGLGRPSGAQD